MKKIFSQKRAFCVLVTLLVLGFTSCNKNDSWIQMVQFYEESQSLPEASKDSIISFNKQFVKYVDSHPGVESDDLYQPTRDNIDYAAELHGFKFGGLSIIITFDPEWEGEDDITF